MVTPRCAATTSGGKQCRKRPIEDSPYCRTHGFGDNGESEDGENGREAKTHGAGAAADRGDWIRREVENLVRTTLGRLPISRVFPNLSPGGIVSAFRENLERLSPHSRAEVLTLLRDFLLRRSEYLSGDTLKTAWQVLTSFVESGRDTLKRRLEGKYEVDEFGLDEEFLDLCRPIFNFLYRYYWRVETTGVRHVPGQGPCLIVANHSGVLPWDGAMVNIAIQEEHTEPRYARMLYLDWFTSVPWVSTLLTRTGQVLACPENGERLLNSDHLVGVFPEGLKGVGKQFKDRYQLARFGRGGFARMAIRCRAPIVPVSVVGAEEIHPVIWQSDTIAKLFGLPYFPITPTFPLLGLLGVIPLPSKWYIHFGEPIRTDEFDPKDADNFLIVSRVAKQVRESIQSTINSLRSRRGSVFLGR